MKILLSSVGNRDPYAIEPKTQEKTFGSIIVVTRSIEPDIVILFPTKQQLNEKLSYTEDRCDAIENIIKNFLPKTAVKKEALDLSDPTDYHDILNQLSKIIEKIKDNYKQSQVEYYVSISSGTPQIQASFLILISSQRLNAKVFQAKDPRFVEAGQEQVREIDVQFVEEENQINRTKAFYEKYQFSSAMDEMLSLSLATRKIEREKLAEIYADILNVYYLVDLFQHKDALIKIKEIIKKLDKLRKNKLLNIIRKQESCLESIVELGQKEGYKNLFDLYHNTYRRYEMCQYIDCLSRFKRIYEGSYFYIARNELNIKRPEQRIEEQEPRIKNWLIQSLGRKEGWINIYDIATLFEIKNGKKRLKENLEQNLKALANQRNYTINNHGMESISREDAKKAVNLLESLLKEVFPEEDLQEHPFSAKYFKEVGEIIFKDI